MRRNLFIICFLLILSLGLLTEAGAFSLQLRSGGGRVTAVDIEDGQLFYSLGLDMFIYEGKYLDFFVGGEYSGLKPESSISLPSWSGSFYTEYSIGTTAAAFGIRLKPAMKGQWKPYLSLGGIGGRVKYSIKSLDYVELLSKSEDSTTFIAYRGGIGTDIGLGERFSLGIEINYTGGVPAFKAIIGDRYTGEVNEIILNENSKMIGLNLGLRYYF